jgi:hypothetical protein
MRYVIAGKSLVAFGAAMLVNSVVAAFVFDALVIDLVALALIPLGVCASSGSIRAARWSLGLMVLYLVAAALLLIGGTLHPERLAIGHRALQTGELRWVIVDAGVFAIWSACNIALLLKALLHPSECA